MHKQEKRIKRVQVMVETPHIACDLDSCREIVEPPTLSEAPANVLTSMSARPDEEGEVEEVLDPDDPLYGLDQRLASLKINEETKQVIKKKLKDADVKIKDNLKARQEAFEVKLASQPTGKKK